MERFTIHRWTGFQKQENYLVNAVVESVLRGKALVVNPSL